MARCHTEGPHCRKALVVPHRFASDWPAGKTEGVVVAAAAAVVVAVTAAAGIVRLGTAPAPGSTAGEVIGTVEAEAGAGDGPGTPVAVAGAAQAPGIAAVGTVAAGIAAGSATGQSRPHSGARSWRVWPRAVVGTADGVVSGNWRSFAGGGPQTESVGRHRNRHSAAE